MQFHIFRSIHVSHEIGDMLSIRVAITYPPIQSNGAFFFTRVDYIGYVHMALYVESLHTHTNSFRTGLEREFSNGRE